MTTPLVIVVLCVFSLIGPLVARRIRQRYGMPAWRSDASYIDQLRRWWRDRA
jgi:hypothetical protein